MAPRPHGAERSQVDRCLHCRRCGASTRQSTVGQLGAVKLTAPFLPTCRHQASGKLRRQEWRQARRNAAFNPTPKASPEPEPKPEPKTTNGLRAGSSPGRGASRPGWILPGHALNPLAPPPTAFHRRPPPVLRSFRVLRCPRPCAASLRRAARQVALLVWLVWLHTCIVLYVCTTMAASIRPPGGCLAPECRRTLLA